ncbi:MAG: DUF3289 family protein, partial [Sediminibacterium sp.]
PFVRDSQQYVNAAMTIKLSATDTSIGYLCDWQYKRQPNQVNKLDDKAEKFALFFMVLDNGVFGHTKFRIIDKNLFKKDNGSATMVELNSRPGNSDVRLNLQYVEQCQDVTVTFTTCGYIQIDGMCFVPGSETERSPFCDHCTKPQCSGGDIVFNYQYCWGQWDFSADDGGPWSPGGTVGGSGGSTPPDPCGGSGGGGQIPESVGLKPQNQPKVSVSECDPNPNQGWVSPNSYYNPNTPFDYLNDPVDAPDDPIIENGVNISDNFNPPNNNGRLIGRSPSRGNIEDMQHGTNGDPTGIFPPYLLGLTDNQLFNDMTRLVHMTSMGDLETVGDDMIQRFRNKTGGQYSNPTLNLRVSQSSALLNYLKIFGGKLKTALQASGGNINNISAIDLTNRPVFNGLKNKFSGLQILINDTESTDIQLENFTIDASGNWTAEVLVTIHDHFGVDKHDALAYQSSDTGFASWWLLQHTRDYVPFETVITVRKTISSHL